MNDEPSADDRRRIGRLAVLWMQLVLGSIVFLGGLVVVYLIRRGRRIRSSQPPPADLPDEFLGGDHDSPTA